MPQKWLITGGCGFIGTRLVAKLRQQTDGPVLRILDNLTVGDRQALGAVSRFQEKDRSDFFSEKERLPELWVGDIKEAETCRAAAQGMDVIVHLAANTGVAPSVEDPAADMQNNVMGVFNMLEAARYNRVGRFIFASSGAPVGECLPPIHEELAPHPVSPYGASKLAGEGYCSAYYRTYGLETVALRFGNVYGPGSGHKGSVVAKFIKQAMRREPLEIYGDGSQTRDFIYIDDLVTAIQLAAEQKDLAGEIFQIATSRETTVGEMVDLLVPILKAAGLPEVTIVNGERRAGDVQRNFSDTTKAREKLQWAARYDLPTGLRQTVDWFLQKAPAV